MKSEEDKVYDEITEQESIYAKDDPQNFHYEESIRGSEYQKAQSINS